MSLSVDIKIRRASFEVQVAFTAGPGVTGVFGPSGAGKSSVISAVAGIARPVHGKITLNGRTLLDSKARVDLPPAARHIGYVFQDGRLFPHLTIRENLTFSAPYVPAGRVKLGEIVDLLDIGKLLDRRPAGLSGGERQRVAIGRALLSNPDCLLMDEPLASLDGPRKAEILPFIERLVAETALPVLYVSHAREEVERLAHQVVMLAEGKVRAIGPPDEVFRGSHDMGRAVIVPPGTATTAGQAVEVAVLAVDGATVMVEFQGTSVRLPRRDFAVEVGQTVLLLMP